MGFPLPVLTTLSVILGTSCVFSSFANELTLKEAYEAAVARCISNELGKNSLIQGSKLITGGRSKVKMQRDRGLLSRTVRAGDGQAETPGYTNILPYSFGRHVMALGPKDAWLDVGAGTTARAQREYRRYWKKKLDEGPECVAIDPGEQKPKEREQTDNEAAKGKFKFHAEGLKEFAARTIKTETRFQVITDVLSATTYDDVSASLQMELDLLAADGVLYLGLGVQSGQVNLSVRTAEGIVPLPRFLASIEGLEVDSNTYRWTEGVSGPIGDDTCWVAIKKKREGVVIPRLLEESSGLTSSGPSRTLVVVPRAR